MAADRADKDHLSTQPIPRGAPNTQANRTLPASEPGAGSPQEQRAGLAKSIADLEGQFQFMGTAHPRYVATKQRLAEMRAMLDQLDDMLKR